MNMCERSFHVRFINCKSYSFPNEIQKIICSCYTNLRHIYALHENKVSKTGVSTFQSWLGAPLFSNTIAHTVESAINDHPWCHLTIYNFLECEKLSIVLAVIIKLISYFFHFLLHLHISCLHLNQLFL